MIDPIATRDEARRMCEEATQSTGWTQEGLTLVASEYLKVLTELERRARIEARRDAYLASKPGLRCAHTIEGGFHWISFFVPGERRKRPVFDGPDYHTALEAALNAAGAP